MAQNPVPAQAASSHPTLHSDPISVIGAQYCLPHPVDLAVVRKFKFFSSGSSITVADINDDNIMFKVKQKHFSCLDKGTVFDPAGNPIVTITKKGMFGSEIFSAKHKHFVFKGESRDSKDLLFTVRRSSVFQWRTTLHIYLASNTSHDVCDFKIKCNCCGSSCVVYAGESNTIVAQMRKKTISASSFLSENRFNVTAFPNVDSAFVATLIAVLDAINRDADSG